MLTRRGFFRGLSAAALASASARTMAGSGAELEVVARSNILLNGAAISRAGRLFCSFPRWTDQDTPGLGEVRAGGNIEPFVPAGWKAARGHGDAERFVSVHSVHIDAADRLWVLDEGTPRVGPEAGKLSARPKVICIDLATNRVERTYRFDTAAAPAGSSLGHVRADANYAYVSDVGRGAIVIVNRQTGECRRVLEGHPVTRADPHRVPTLNGRPMLRNGKPFLVPLDLLDLSADGQWLYFAALCGPRLYRVAVTTLNDRSLSTAALGAAVEAICEVPAVSGISHAPDGSLYLSALTEYAILRMDTDRNVRTYVQDQRLNSPNEGSIRDGWLYVPASQTNGMPIFHAGVSELRPPFFVYRLRIL